MSEQKKSKTGPLLTSTILALFCFGCSQNSLGTLTQTDLKTQNMELQEKDSLLNTKANGEANKQNQENPSETKLSNESGEKAKPEECKKDDNPKALKERKEPLTGLDEENQEVSNGKEGNVIKQMTSKNVERRLPPPPPKKTKTEETQKNDLSVSGSIATVS